MRLDGTRQGGLSLCLAINTEKGENSEEERKVLKREKRGEHFKTEKEREI
jgi:hypothetical protein